MKFLPAIQKLALLGVVLLASRTQARAELLSYWNFNNNSPAYNSGAGTLGSLNTAAAAYGETYTQTSNSVPGTLGGNTANSTIFKGSGIFIDFSNLSSTNVGSGATINGKLGPAYTAQATTGGLGGYGIFADSTLNRAGTDSTSGGSLLLLNNTAGNTGLNGKYLTFDLSSSGYKTLSLSYAARVTTSVTASSVWSYSTDGTNYSALTTITPPATATFTSETLDLSTLSSNALDNQAAFFLRLTYSTANAGGSQAFDNFQLTGVPVSVPEPSTSASVGVVLLGVFLCLRRRGLQRA